MFFQKPEISRDVQNMMQKIITKKICNSSSSLFVGISCNEIFDGKINNIRSRKFSMTSRIKKQKQNEVEIGRYFIYDTL